MRIDHSIEDRSDRLPIDIAIDGRSGPFDFKTLKANGVIKQRQKERFTVRLKCPGGRIPVEKLARIAEVAKQYGGDFVHVSVRQSIEIPFVHAGEVGQVKRELEEVGQEIASAGPRVRVPTACSGCEYNPKGLTNTQEMAAKVCERFFAKQPLPHKFKLGFAGCPNDCSRSAQMDLGFQGAVKPGLDSDACTGCGLCAKACQECAIENDPETGRPRFDPEKCLFCGDCVRGCPARALHAEQTGWIVRVGAKHGRHPIDAARIAAFVPDEKIPEIIEAVLAWYEKQGREKGRVRIGALMLDEALWADFLEHVGPVLGKYAIEGPRPPRLDEIHF